MTKVDKLVGLTVYEVAVYGQHAQKPGQPFSREKTITGSYNTGYGGSWVNGDSTGKSYRLMLNGVKSEYVAKCLEDGFELPVGLSTEPVGELI